MPAVSFAVCHSSGLELHDLESVVLPPASTKSDRLLQQLLLALALECAFAWLLFSDLLDVCIFEELVLNSREELAAVL